MPSLKASPSGRRRASASSVSRGSTSSNSPKKENFGAPSSRTEKAAYLVVKRNTDDPLESVDEFIRALQHAGRNPTRKFVGKYWTRSTRAISFQDFCRIVKDEPENSDEELRKAFRKIDRNGDHFISFDELKFVLQQKGEKLTPKEIEEIFIAADLNSDGRIDYNEFVVMVRKTTTETREAALNRLDRIEKTKLSGLKQSRSPEKFRNGPIAEENGIDSPVSSTKVDLKQEDDSGAILKIPASKSQFKDGPNSKKLSDWFYTKRKGCFFYDDVLVAHRYSIHQPESQTLWISISPITNTNMPASSSSNLPVDTLLFVLEKNSLKVKACTQERDKNGCFHTKCCLEPGEYVLLPYTTGCRFTARKEAWKENGGPHSKNVDLIETTSDNKTKLTKQFRMVLMNIFELFDLDDSGGLNREEFNLYNVRTGDDHVTDDEWDVVKENFETKNNELTLKGFIKLHQVEAEETEGDTEDMWISLESVGYNHKLQMDEVCPFLVEIYAEDSRISLKTEIVQPICSGNLWRSVVEYMTEHSKLQHKDEGLLLHAFLCPFYSILLFQRIGGTKKSYSVDVPRKQNVHFAYFVGEVGRNLKHHEMIALPFVPENEEEETRLSLKVTAGSSSSRSLSAHDE